MKVHPNSLSGLAHGITFFVTLHIVVVSAAPKALIAERIRKAELSLLADVAFGRKSFAQVKRDAQTFSYQGTELQSLVFANASYGVTKRLVDVTGVSSDSLTFIKIRTQDGISPHPFSLLTDHIEREYGRDGSCFDVNLPNGRANFLSSKEYLTHPLVQLFSPVQEVSEVESLRYLFVDQYLCPVFLGMLLSMKVSMYIYIHINKAIILCTSICNYLTSCVY